MTKEFTVAVAGATGAVGVEMVKTLEKRNFPVKNLKLLASARSAGKTMKFKGEDVVIEEQRNVVVQEYEVGPFKQVKVCEADDDRQYDRHNSEHCKENHIRCNHEVCNLIAYHLFQDPLSLGKVFTSTSFFGCCVLRHLH